MAKITIEELYRGEKYDIMSAVAVKSMTLSINKVKREWNRSLLRFHSLFGEN